MDLADDLLDMKNSRINWSVFANGYCYQQTVFGYI